MAQIARQQLGWRMRAMPYLYTAFYDAHTFGCPVARPLFFAFPGDSGAFEASSRQWLMGDGLLIAPVTQVGSALAVRRGAGAGAGSCLHVHLDLGFCAGIQLHAAQLPASARACVQHAWDEHAQPVLPSCAAEDASAEQENSTNVNAYFPAAKWYSLYDYSVVDASAGSVTRNYEVCWLSVVLNWYQLKLLTVCSTHQAQCHISRQCCQTHAEAVPEASCLTDNCVNMPHFLTCQVVHGQYRTGPGPAEQCCAAGRPD